MSLSVHSETTPARPVRYGPSLGQEFSHDATLAAMHRDAEGCERCDLFKHATHLVFGAGPLDAPVVLVGEQPGDQEDRAGQPFVGPSGRMLDQCLEEADVDRAALYVTNAVKHFKFTLRGKKRLHSKPNAGEIRRCAWWLGGELNLIQPKLVVALGATALYSLLGSQAKVTRDRGRLLKAGPYTVLVTIHPSSLLRSPDREAAQRSRALFVKELGEIKEFLS
jgi:DNA polymerase